MTLSRHARFARFVLPCGKLLALFLCILGCKLWLIREYGGALPYFDQWDGEGDHLLRPWVEGHYHWSDLFTPHNQHRIALTRLLVLGLFQLNGQWDTRVEMIAAAFIHAACAVFLGLILSRRLGRTCEHPVLLCLLFLFGLPFAWEDTLSGGFQSQYYFLILLSLLRSGVWAVNARALGGGGWESPPRWGRGSAFRQGRWRRSPWGCSPAIKLRRRDGPGRDLWITLAVSAVLSCAGMALALDVHQEDDMQALSVWAFAVRQLGYMSWPTATPALGVILFAPFAILLWKRLRSPEPWGATEGFLFPFGIWVLLQEAALAYARNRHDDMTISRYMDVESLGVIVNFASALILVRGATRRARLWDPVPCVCRAHFHGVIHVDASRCPVAVAADRL